MSTRGTDDAAMAHACLKMWRYGGPYSLAAKKSLEGLAKTLDNLDPAARALLSTVGISVKGTRERTEVCLRSFKHNLKRGDDDILYRMAVEHLVRDYRRRIGRSPVTDGHMEEFQNFAGDVMKSYGARRPSEDYVREAVSRLRRGNNPALLPG